MSTFPIATLKTTTTANSLTISNIPQSYTSLILDVSLTGTATSGQFPSIVYNNDTGNNYCQTWMYQNGASTSTVYSSRSALRGYWGPSITNVNNGGSRFSNQTILIADYTATNKWKVSSSESNDESQSYGGGTASVWKSTSAINSIKIYLETGSMGAGSKVTLMGVKA